MWFHGWYLSDYQPPQESQTLQSQDSTHYHHSHPQSSLQKIPTLRKTPLQTENVPRQKKNTNKPKIGKVRLPTQTENKRWQNPLEGPTHPKNTWQHTWTRAAPDYRGNRGNSHRETEQPARSKHCNFTFQPKGTDGVNTHDWHQWISSKPIEKQALNVSITIPNTQSKTTKKPMKLTLKYLYQ